LFRRTKPRGSFWPGLRVHHDESGSISIVSVFALLLLVFVLGMVMNSGRQVDQKIKMQNAVDAATYSGGVVLTRAMNTLSFTNHLLCDVFALTAFLREGSQNPELFQGGNAAGMAPEILDNWDRVAPAFAGSEFERFAELGGAIPGKVQYEREMVRTYSVWAAATAELILPVMEDILAQRQIPEFQRALVRTTPELAQHAMDQVARRHGRAWPEGTQLRGELWRTVGDPVGGRSEDDRRTLPVVDPVMDTEPNQEQYFNTAKRQRRSLAHTYLRHWNNDTLRAFDRYGKMSQFGNLWRVFTCGHLEHLLEVEYPNTNLPFVIRHTVSQIDNVNVHLLKDFMFVGVVYREQMRDRVPGVFRNPVPTDTQAYAQIMMYVPRRRLVKGWRVTGQRPPQRGASQGGVPGESVYLPAPDDGTSEPPPSGGEGEEVEWYVHRQSGRRYPTHWDLQNQNWSVQLVPATAPSIPRILSTQPYVNGITNVDTPDLWGIREEDFLWISNH